MCPYFGILWPAGRVLGEMIATPDENPTFKIPLGRILEVGCGLGIPSLVLAKLGHRPVLMDIHPDVPRFLARNCQLNGIPDLKFVRSDWSQWPEPGKWDTVVASDVLYDRAQPRPLLQFLDRALAPGGRALISDPGRGYWSGFLDEAERLSVQSHWTVSTRGLFGVNTCVISRSAQS